MEPFEKYLVAVDEIEPLDVGEDDGFKNVDSRLLICKDTVGKNVKCCLFRGIFPPGAYHANHVHMKSDELLFCISGKAVQSVGDVEYVMTPNTAMILPKGIPHFMRNDGPEPFVVIGVYPEACDFEDTDQHLVP